MLVLVACGSRTPEPIENRTNAKGGTQCARATGIILDRDTGEPLIGATIVVSGDTGTDEDVAITEEHGKFDMPLHPDRRVITIYFSDATHTQTFEHCEGIRISVSAKRRNSNLP